MSLEGWKAIFEISGVILLFLTFVSGAGILLTSTRINERQAGQLREFNAKLTAAQTELSQQQERAAKAELQLAQLEKLRHPRMFPLAGFVASLKDHGARADVEIWYQPDDSEALMFAQQIMVGLNAAHWRVSEPIPIPAAAKQSHLPNVASILQLPPALRVGAQPFGVSLISHSLASATSNNKSPFNVLTHALQELQLGNVGGGEDAILSENKIRLIVAPKP